MKVEIKKNIKYSSITREVDVLLQLKSCPRIPTLYDYGNYINNE